MDWKRIAAIGATVGTIIGSLALVGAPAAGAAYASNGEPVWIPRDAANTADLLRANNQALARIGNRVYLGGDFTELAPELGAPAVQQAHLAAFDATVPSPTGAGTGVPIVSFAPQLDGPVYALVADALTNTLYVGGAFAGGFAILDGTSGAPKGTQITTDGEVHSLFRDGNDLYIGGQFQRVTDATNHPRKMMAKINLTNLTVDGDFDPAFVGGMVAAIDIPPDHSRIYAGGRFTTLDGAAVGKIVALSPSPDPLLSGKLDPTFAPAFNTTKQPVEDVEAINTKVFVAFGGGYNRLIQFATNGDQQFGSCGDGDVQEVHLVNNGSVLLVGGHFAGNPKKNCTLATIPTARIAEYQVNDVAGSLPVVVNPTPFSSVYANDLGVWEFLGDTLTDIWVAGDFLKVSSRNTGGLAHFFDGQTFTDGQNPSPPSNVQVSGATPGGFTVTWSPSTDNKGVAGYYVWVDGVRRSTAIGTTATVSGLNPGATTTVQVQAFDVKLNLSGLSAGVPGNTLTDGVPPAAPTNLRVLNGGTTELVLGWNAAVDNGTVTEYLVYADGNLLGTTGGLTLPHSGLIPGSQHSYEVVAKDAAGNLSGPSTTLNARAYTVVLNTNAVWRYSDVGALADFGWREIAYDDSAWPKTGPAPVGYGKPNLGTTIGWGPSNSNRYLTSYARTTFNLADPAGITGLALRLRGTDGAAVFINSKLAYNDNLPAALEPDLGALTARDTAALDVTREFRVPVNPAMLVAGTNVVAVEFHKYAPNSSYLAFATEISLGLPAGSTPPPSAPTGVTATVVAGPAVQVGWSAVSGAANYEVRRNGSLLTTVTTPGYTDPNPLSNTLLSYTVRTIDGLGQSSSDSLSADVTITAPAAPANLVAGVVGSSVQLTWDSVGGATSYVVLRNSALLTTVPTPGYTDPTPGTGTITYTVRTIDGIGQQSGDSAPASVTITAPPTDTVKPSTPGKPTGSATDTTATMSWTPSTDNVGVTGYRIYRNGAAVNTTSVPSFNDIGLVSSTAYKYRVAAYDAAGNESAKSTALNLTTAASGGSGVLSNATDWRYTETRTNLGTTWKDLGYVFPPPPDTTWKTGKPELGFGDGGEGTVIGHGGSTSSTGVITWYFRTTFDVADPTGLSFVANLVRDDGAVVYLNGVEVFRSNMPAGAVSYTTRASSSLGGADETNPVAFTVLPGALGALVAGTNVIAVELHNVGPVNADASFKLTATVS